ncbi:helicase-related protein [Aquisediminimonas profunda]|uniref:helicase-related protein n=1 Tax=Aquisediminimonas profunda TaxID=1550733 RepID=UPI001C62C96C|nr:helicase-related protein [Aquisediminimonas profunda]
MSGASVKAVLGPTNTGKTHLAIERLCAHSSGMMGFPLRLLAREVFDRVRSIKGDSAVALITGEEKILPPHAKWLICTVESMPVERDVAFVAIDEAQLGSDPERGHVFTDRILNVRGREETMILGAATLAPLLRSLVPEAEIINRPRFSNLSYGGPKKLSRLPARSAIVAFSAEEVYGIAEMIRRTRGGSAVVLGALSPRTRNAQVAMFESGDVDYLVATDAIGMGLNLDLGHVAFASLSKFDGKRQRRLYTSEMAQIAGRAGRHQRDGTFGVLAGGERQQNFTDVEIERIENHRFAPLDHLFWREAEPDFTCMDALIASLERTPDLINLRPAPEAIDLAVLKRIQEVGELRDLLNTPARIARLWEVCGLPDFRHMGAEFHSRLVMQIFRYLESGAGVIPAHAIASELARLDSVQGDISALTGRIAAVRTWAYASQRRDWLTDAEEWAERTVALEQRLSDALHEKLTQRFVDRRTTLLVRSMAADAPPLDVRFAENGAIMVEDEPLGTLDGFVLRIDHATRLEDHKRLIAAVEKRLPSEIERRALLLIDGSEREFTLCTLPGQDIAILWKGASVATLRRGRTLLTPSVLLHSALGRLPPVLRLQVQERLETWLTHCVQTRLAPLNQFQRISKDPEMPAAIRAIIATLISTTGLCTRSMLDTNLEALPPPERRRLRQTGIVIGALDIFHHGLLKPEATRLRMALLAVERNRPMPPLPMPGLTLLDRPAPELAASALDAGYRNFGNQMVRIDLVERIARALHEQRSGKSSFVPDATIATQLGIGQPTLARIMRALGFKPAGSTNPELWRWIGRHRRKQELIRPSGSFAVLRDWIRKEKS